MAKFRLPILVSLLFISFMSFSMNQDELIKDSPIDKKTKAEVIAGVLKNLNDSYVFPDVAKNMELAINHRLANGEYEAVTSSIKFVELLTSHLRDVSHDKHLGVFFNINKIPLDRQNKRTPEEIERRASFDRSINHGFRRVEILPGNVGYIGFDGFFDVKSGSNAVAAAMAFVSNTDALILDIRKNGGGEPAMVAFISSYFFGPKPVHLNDIFWRPTNKTTQWWTKRSIPGHRYLNKEIYVLTSNKTFSAAEEFAYNLKNLKRATIVGEQTGGGAHPGGAARINDHFAVWVPKGRAINPITKTNWEGVGVTPDMVTEEANALEVAHKSALTNVLEKTSDEGKIDALKQVMEQKLTTF